jgi:CTP:molybdopterin cytidylyltransferase MocA
MRHHRRVTSQERGPVVAGLLLAAGAGRRMGSPKALLRHPPDDAHPDGEPWVARAARALLDGGCSPVLVVLGAAADQVRPLVPPGVRVVVATDWDEGMGASLRRGLTALLDPADGAPAAVGVVVSLVDLPGVTAAVVGRLRAAATGPQVLARAAYDGEPGHPVLLGAVHWRAAAEQAAGDAGARGYLAGREVRPVECGDLGSGEDVDRPVGAGG